MDDVVKVEWLAGEATVPYVGSFLTGEEYTLPTEQAQGFIDAGKAKLVTPRRTRNTTTEE